MPVFKCLIYLFCVIKETKKYVGGSGCQFYLWRMQVSVVWVVYALLWLFFLVLGSPEDKGLVVGGSCNGLSLLVSPSTIGSGYVSLRWGGWWLVEELYWGQNWVFKRESLKLTSRVVMCVNKMSLTTQQEHLSWIITIHFDNWYVWFCVRTTLSSRHVLKWVPREVEWVSMGMALHF